jgi:HAD superfamily hydrolase (TIGR01490 family)
MPRAALFDLDRTLVRRETASLYVRYQRDIGEAKLLDLARVMIWVTQYTFGVIDAEAVAARAVRELRGQRESELARKCADFFPKYVLQHVTHRGRDAVEAHRKRGDILAIVTGASRYAAAPLSTLLGIEHLVTSELEVDTHGLFTGRLLRPLCYGQGKVERASRLAAALGFDLAESTFYSDSYTDLPLLSLVKEPVCVNPDLRLRREAKRRGWRIERW